MDGRSGGKHVIDEEDAATAYDGRIVDGEGAGDVAPPCRFVELYLRCCRPPPFEGVHYKGSVQAALEMAAEEDRLIEATPAQAVEVKRDRDDHVGSFCQVATALGEQAAEAMCEARFRAVLVAVEGAPQRVGVVARVEQSAGAGPGERRSFAETASTGMIRSFKRGEGLAADGARRPRRRPDRPCAGIAEPRLRRGFVAGVAAVRVDGVEKARQDRHATTVRRSRRRGNVPASLARCARARFAGRCGGEERPRRNL